MRHEDRQPEEKSGNDAPAVTAEDVVKRRNHYAAGAEGTQQIPHPPDAEADEQSDDGTGKA